MEIFWLILVLLLLITPLQARLTLRHAARTEGVLTLRAWGFSRDLRFRVAPTAQGRQLILEGKRVHPVQAQPAQLRSALVSVGTFLRSDRARKFFLRHVELQELSISTQLCLDNAARTAMITGVFRTLYSLLPPAWRRRVRLYAAPDFLHTSSSAYLRCILFTHLGTLVITAAMLLIAWMLERREHRSDRPKEESA